jgi:hydrogenase 3 maturation protease
MPAKDLIKNLKNRIKTAKRIAIMGVGSELRADDVAGLIVVRKVQKGLAGRKTKQKVLLLEGCTAPENFTGEIIKFKTNHLILVDCADISEIPGTISMIDPENVGGVSFSTHMLPLKIIVDYLVASIKCKVTIIGIQPETLDYSKKITSPVKTSAGQVASALLAAIN